MEEVIRIPSERIKVLIGEKGETKKMLEKKCKVKLDVSSEGEVQLTGESAELYFAKDVIIAIGRGFNPRMAIKILGHDYQFYLLHLRDYLKSDNAIKRIKGRIIGEKGAMKKEIENAADCRLSVYGNTVGIIAKTDSVEYAREAVEKLIRGSKHASVYRYLGSVRRRLMEDRLRGV